MNAWKAFSKRNELSNDIAMQCKQLIAVLTCTHPYIPSPIACNVLVVRPMTYMKTVLSWRSLCYEIVPHCLCILCCFFFISFIFFCFFLLLIDPVNIVVVHDVFNCAPDFGSLFCNIQRAVQLVAFSNYTTFPQTKRLITFISAK